MSLVSVKIENLEELRRAFKESPQIAERWIQKALDASMIELRNARAGNVPIRTGGLIHSFKLISGRLWARLWPDIPYAIYVHEGTRPHVILPLRKRALYWPGAAHPVRSVQHPGSKPNRFLERMGQSAQKKINKHFEVALQKISEEIAKGK
jgi:hypothetical protein